MHGTSIVGPIVFSKGRQGVSLTPKEAKDLIAYLSE
jgi:hypothetical protein